MTTRVPFQLLEINVISAQDLAPISKSMQTYAVAWVHPERKLTTKVDQQGHTNPTWNDKFVFRVDEEFLIADTSAIMIEIYSAAWLRDIRVGTVRVLISNLLPPSSRVKDNSNTRFVALQVRRPSGRPQGILNVGVTLLDSTLRSMPLYTELSTSALGYRDLMDEKMNKHINPSNATKDEDKQKNGNKIQLRRTQSDRSETVRNDYPQKPSSICNGSICNAGSVYNGSIVNGSELGVPAKPGMGNGSLCSDVGPSPSVVAAAIAKGIYPRERDNHKMDNDAGSSILEDWTENSSVEGLRTKIERWRTELPPIYDRAAEYRKMQPSNRRHSRRHTDGGGNGGLFSCFGNAYGCEFTIVCGANNQKKKKHTSAKVHLSPSDQDNLSRSFI